MMKTILLLLLTALLWESFSCVSAQVVLTQTPQLLDPLTIPKWVNQLDEPPPVFVPTNITNSAGKLIRQEFEVRVTEFNQQMLPTIDSDGNPTGFGSTKVFGFEGKAEDAVTGKSLGSVRSTPGPTFEALQGVPIQVKWVNNLVDAMGKPLPHIFPVDPTLHWANPNGMEMPMPPVIAPSFPPGYPAAQSPVPIVIHLHGGEVPSASDGHPDAWWTADGRHGPAYNTALSTDANSAVFVYPNEQPPTTLWYHDHALGITNLNVMAGLAGFYLLRNASDPIAELLPGGEYEMPLVIQDRNFLADGSFYVPSEGSNPDIHPYWNHFFEGNTIMVNGKVWPNMNVKQGQYRFRILDGSSTRFYNITFSNGMPFVQIGSDGGYLKTPVQLTSLILGPAERVDILVDFSNINAGQKIILKNDFSGSILPVEEQTVGQMIQFTITGEKGAAPKSLPSNLNPTLAGSFPSLPTPTKQRILTMTVVGDPSYPLAMLLDGQKWAASISEKPELETTEDWIFVNPTLHVHPIHLHLVQFQLVRRQAFNTTAYMLNWAALNGETPLNHSTINVPSLDPYLIGSAVEPSPSEQGWKDTIIVYSGEVVIIRIRFAPQAGSDYTFDATAGPGYVWHCHSLPHEDNEMMRPYVIARTAEQGVVAWLPVLIVVMIVFIVAILGFMITRQLRFRRRSPSIKN